jgi:predicted RNA-binding protein with PUA-like domain
LNYWLLKSEPDCYSVDQLKADGKTPWSGIRNYQARNFMRDGMKVGDLCLFYHSSTADPRDMGVAGIGKVVSKPYPDPTATDKKSEYYEPNPKIEWVLVDIKFVKKLKRIVTLKEMKIDPALKSMMLVRPGMRLSIQPVSEKDFNYIVDLSSRLA